jgi:hypothetical protein
LNGHPQATITDPTLAADQSSLGGMLIDPGMLTSEKQDCHLGFTSYG